MNRVIICVGKVAAVPFYVDKVFVNVYTAEELCYVLYENAFLLDRDICDKKLAEWIDKQLMLPDLARELYGLINANASAAAFVGTILTYVGYYTGDEIAKAESILKLNISMNAFEKMKAKADFLVENKHYTLALREYEQLLSVLPDDETALRSRILNNMGITYMHLYIFESAERCFLRAYECDNNEMAYKHFLAVKRMRLPENDYIREVTDQEEAYKVSISLESDLEKARHDFDESDEAKKLKELFAARTSPDAPIYYEEMSRITEGLKDDYKDFVLDSERGNANTENII